MIHMFKLYSLIPIWMTMTWIQYHRAARKPQLLRVYFCKVLSRSGFGTHLLHLSLMNCIVIYCFTTAGSCTSLCWNKTQLVGLWTDVHESVFFKLGMLKVAFRVPPPPPPSPPSFLFSPVVNQFSLYCCQGIELNTWILMLTKKLRMASVTGFNFSQVCLKHLTPHV